MNETSKPSGIKDARQWIQKSADDEFDGLRILKQCDAIGGKIAVLERHGMFAVWAKQSLLADLDELAGRPGTSIRYEKLQRTHVVPALVYGILSHGPAPSSIAPVWAPMQFMTGFGVMVSSDHASVDGLTTPILNAVNELISRLQVAQAAENYTEICCWI